MVQFEEFKKQIENFTPKKKHDVFAIEVIKEAINAAKKGNFGVGAALVNKEGKVLYRGQNKVFSKKRSDLHAEMDLLNTFEADKSATKPDKKDLMLFTSLESCPMCMCRTITAGIKEVYHIADDEFGGMVNLKNQLPHGWQGLAKTFKFKKADCSKELSAIALQIFLETIKLNDKL